MRVRVIVLAGLLMAFCLELPANADVPRRLNFQGILLDSVETVVPDGTYELIFRIFDAQVGGTVFWSEPQTLQTVNGLFNTFLGISSPIPDSVFSGPDRWLEIQLAENTEPYEPRGKIGSVAYSYRVGTIDAATGGRITGQLTIEGDQSSISLLPDQLGDDAVQVPDDAISSAEILDEPGLAQGMHPGDFDLTGLLNLTDVVVCTLTTPAPGFIVVEAVGQSRFAGTNVNRPNYFDYQLDETSGGDLDSNFYQRIGFGASAAIANTWWPFSIRRTYYKPEAGTFVFRLEAADRSIEGTKSIWNSVITATYFPRAYGPVQSALSNSENGIPPGARAIMIQGDNESNPGPTRETYEFDLQTPK